MFKASLRFWNFLMDVVGNTPKASALPTAPHLDIVAVDFYRHRIVHHFQWKVKVKPRGNIQGKPKEISGENIEGNIKRNGRGYSAILPNNRVHSSAVTVVLSTSKRRVAER